MSEQETEFKPTDLNDVFSDTAEKSEDKTEKVDEVETKTDESKEKTEEPEEKTEDKSEEKSEDKSEEKTDDKSESKDETQVPLSAMLKERDKTRSAKARVVELEAKLDPQEKPKPTSVFDNEEGFRSEITKEIDGKLYQDRLANSQEDAIEKYGVEVTEAAMTRLGELAKENPQLAVRFQQSRRPFIEAVKIVQEAETTEKMGDPKKFEADIRESERKRVLAEIDELSKKETAIDDSLPESTLKTESKDSLNAGDKDFVKTPLDKVYND